MKPNHYNKTHELALEHILMARDYIAWGRIQSAVTALRKAVELLEKGVKK